MSELYVGLMSGTSMDGIDAALVEFEESSLNILHTQEFNYSSELRDQLLAAITIPLDQPIDNIPELNKATGECFRDAALQLLSEAGVSAENVTAIGSHGQTLRHQPDAATPFSLQIADAQLIADGTGVPTIADFRSADIAAGGQGAPLAPYFHEWLFRTASETRCVLNVGGVANVTVIADGEDTIGFDTGPGNSLMDAWIRKHRGEKYDKDGSWAATGNIDDEVLDQFLAEPYFAFAPPKSTGFEHFNLRWIEGHDLGATAPSDIQATLCELSAVSIADAIIDYAPTTSDVLVCGGGAHNPVLMRQLADRLPNIDVISSSDAGLDPDWVEAAAFAWLAMRHLRNLPGNLPSVTGASEPVVLGRLFQPH
ncbi:MAG: anhydro-N-acetylmuramic acid kinase [Woeseiaceae bacterium]